MAPTRIRKYVALMIAAALVAAACSGGAAAETDEPAPQGTDQTAATDTTAADLSSSTTDDPVAAESSDSSDAIASSGSGDLPDDLPFPIPAGGNVFNYLDDPSQPVLVMQYEGDRSDEFIAFYEDWIANDASVEGTPNITDVVTLFTLTNDGAFGGIITIAVAPTGDVTGITLGWSRSDGASQGDAAAGGDTDTAGDTPVMAAADLPADPPAPFPAGGEVNQFSELESGNSLTLMYKGTHRKEFVAFYESWAADVGAETTSSEDGPLGHAFEFELDGQPVIVDVKGGEPPAGLTMVTVLWRRP